MSTLQNNITREYKMFNNNCNSKTNGESKFLREIEGKINVIFDVGCRYDTEFTMFHGEVHYFDPVTDYIENLKTQYNANKISYFNNVGLGNENKELYYYPLYQSFYDRTNSCGVSNNSEKRSLTIKKAKDYIIEKKVGSIDFLKIDTEGHEFDVLLGFEDFLEKVKIIQFEYGETFLDNNRKLIDVITYLQ
jgi:FkbM family methyltransferase